MKSHNQIINEDKFKLSAAQVIYGSYVRKNKLRELVYNTYGNSSIAQATKLNIYVDINSIIHALYSEHNRITIDNITDISAGIINLCAHYRSFFRESLMVDTRIFLINSLNLCDINRKYVAEYNGVFMNKVNVTQGKKLIDTNMNLLKVLCPYLPAIYYIESQQQFETAVIIAGLIESLNDENPNLIISHDIYPLQLCAQYKWTSYLYPYKSKDADGNTTDTSWMIPVNDKPNFREEFWNKYCMARRIHGSTLYKISPVNFPLLLALTKFPERNIMGNIISIPTAVNAIYDIVGGEDIKIDHSQLMNHPILSNGTVDARYKVLDAQYALQFYKSSPEINQIQLLDLDDPNTVAKIVSKYYDKNPINIFSL